MNKSNQLKGKPWAQNRTNFDRSLAVVIGIDRYEDENIHDLSTPVSDANAFADLLETEYEYKPKNVLRLINQKATLEELRTLLTKKLPNQLKPTDKDRLIFYFAGHGLPKNSDEGPTGYLVPQDAKLGQESSFLPMSDVYEALNQLQCHHLLVVLDCCFAGTFRWANSRKLIAELETIRREHYDRFIRHPAWQVIISSAHDQEALDFVKLSEDRRGNPIQVNNERHSPFALALLEALKEGEPDSQGKRYQNADFTKDGVITAHELFVYLGDRVRQLAKELQTPGLYPLKREYDKGEFIFVKPGFDPQQLLPAPELNEENNPYRGLKSFEERHANFFFGRQKLVEEVSNRLGKSHRPLTVVLGTSGSGKSSLVKAGLVPYLRQQEEKDESAQRWYILDPIRPGKSPFAELARAVLPVANSNLISRLADVSFMSRRFAEILDPKSKQKAASQNLTASGDREQLSSDSGDKSFDATKLAERWNKANSEAKLLLILDYFEQLQGLFRLQSQEQTQLSSLHDEINNTLKPLTENLQHQPESFIELMTAWSQNHPKTKLLLVIDQFEELITMSQDDRESGEQSDSQEQDRQKQWQRFLTLLRIALAKYRRQLHVIVTLRSDFEPRFLNSALKAQWKDARFPIRAMNSDELRDAIEGPALKQALYFEPPELVGKLIDEVGQMPGALPLLSFTLSELYIKLFDRWMKDKSTDRALQIKEYEKLGGVAGALTRRATEEYDDLVRDFGEALGKVYQTTMQRIMLRMVTVEAGGVARRRVLESELVYPSQEENERVKCVSDRLVHARLLVTGQETGEPYVEPAHDFLVRGWKKLQDWINEEQGNLNLQQRLTPQANDWHKNNQNTEYLWIRDPRLFLLEKLLESKTNNWLNQLETEFVHNSKHKRLDELEETQRQLKISEERRLNAELREQATRVQYLLPFQPLDMLVLAIQSVGMNLDGISEDFLEQAKHQKVLAIVQQSLHIALENVKISVPLKGHTGAITSVAFSPDGKLIASGSNDSTVRFWDLNGTSIGQPLQMPKGVLSSVAFSPDGQLVAVGVNKTIWLWRTNSNLVNRAFQGHEKGITSVAFSPDGQLIASAGKDATVRLWDIDGNSIGQPFQGHKGTVYSMAFSPNGELIASGGWDKNIYIWNKSGDLIKKFEGHDEDINSVTFSPDGELIATGSGDKTIRLWDIDGNSIGQPFQGHQEAVYSVSFSPDGQTIVSGGADKTVRLWDVKGNSIAQPLQEYKHVVTSVAFSPDGQRIISGDNDWIVRLWDIRNTLIGLPFKVNDRGVKDVRAVAFSPDGQWIVCANNDGKLRLWNLDGNLVGQPFQGHERFVNCVAFSPDGKQIVSGSDDKTLCLWDLNGNLIKKPFQKHTGYVYSVAFSPDGHLIVSGSRDHTICLWDINGNSIGQPFQGHKGAVYSVAFSPNNKLIVSASEDETIRLWDYNGNSIGQPFRGHKYKVYSVAFSPDGQWIVSGGHDKTIRLWNINGTPVCQPFQGHEGAVNSVAFSPNGQWIVSGSSDGTVSVWDIDGNPVAQPLQGHKHKVSSVAFSPNGRLIASGSHDGTIRLWLGNWNERFQLACDRLRYHPYFRDPESIEDPQQREIAISACKTCHKYVWNKSDSMASNGRF
jgi:WD40 repeat protein